MRIKHSKIDVFKRIVWRHYRKLGRNSLPWRKTREPYKILVSEVMLQQTQVARVLEKYKEFLKAFPTATALGRAPLADVLRVWSGMGYNRRAKFLRDAAKVIVGEHGGRVPRDAAALRSLPGVGSYTASAVRVFAFCQPDILIETNVRSAFIHHFFSNSDTQCLNSDTGCLNYGKVSDPDILPIAAAAAKGQKPREWHWALMDYGAHIKKLHGNPSRRSAHYARQSKFEGSLRQVRGAILRSLARHVSIDDLRGRYSAIQLRTALASLARDGLVARERGRWSIPTR